MSGALSEVQSKFESKFSVLGMFRSGPLPLRYTSLSKLGLTGSIVSGSDIILWVPKVFGLWDVPLWGPCPIATHPKANFDPKNES